MNKAQSENLYHLRNRLDAAGFTFDETTQLLRIESTLSRWSALECGDGNNHASWAIERDEETEKPYMVRHIYNHGNGKDYTTKTPIADREKGALKRLARIMEAHPDFVSYQQGDPRGCALYIVKKSDLNGSDIRSNYTRGIAVCY